METDTLSRKRRRNRKRSHSLLSDESIACLYVLTAVENRIGMMYACGEDPFKSLAITRQNLTFRPCQLIEWIALEPGRGNSMERLFRRRRTLLRAMLEQLGLLARHRITRNSVEGKKQALLRAIELFRDIALDNKRQ